MKRRTFLTGATLLGAPLASGGQAALESAQGNPADDLIANVRHFGAVGDGIRDDSEAIQAAVLSSSTVYFPPGDYLVRTKIDLQPGSTLIGNSSATLTSDSTSYILRAQGRIGALQNLRQDARRGHTSIRTSKTDALAFADSDGFFLRSDRIPLGHRSHRAGEIGTLVSSDSAGIQLAGCLMDDYLRKDNAALAPVSYANDVTISGLTLRNTNFRSDPDRVTSALIYLEFVRNFRIEHCQLRENNGAGIAAFNCSDGVIQSNLIQQLGDHHRGVLGYGVQLGFSSRNICVSSNNFSECRHAVTTGTGTRSSKTPNHGVSRNLTISANTVFGCSNAGLDTHEDSDGVVIFGNTISGCNPVGIHIRSYRSSVTGNTITNCTRIGIRVSSSAKDSVINSNCVTGILGGYSSGDGISIESPSINVSGNRVSRCHRHGIFVKRSATHDVSITGNSCTDNGQGGSGDGIRIHATSENRAMTVVGNTCSDFQATPTQRDSLTIDGASLSDSSAFVSSNNF